MKRLVTPRAIVTAAVVGVYLMFVARIVDHLGGIPTSREIQTLVILGGFAAASLTSVARVRKLVLGVLFDWLPFVLVLAVYDLLRGYADGALYPAQSALQIDIDKALGAGAVPTVWLQQHCGTGPTTSPGTTTRPGRPT